MLKSKFEDGDVQEIRTQERLDAERQKKEAEEERKAALHAKANRNRRYEKLFTPSEAVDYKNIVSQNKESKVNAKLKPVNVAGHVKPVVKDDSFVDNPDVPPLC